MIIYDESIGETDYDNKSGNTELLGILLFLFIQFNDNWTGNTNSIILVLK